MRAGAVVGAWIGVGMPARSFAAAPADDITWLPAWRLRELVARKELSPVEVVEHFLGRIEALDGALGAFVVVDAETARAEARRAEAAVTGGRELGALHGVPVAVKQMVRATGLPLETGETARRDSVAVERIRRAGGIVIGNTSLAGPAAMLGTAEIGAANPWNEARVAGASSSGSAASVAAGLCPLAIGTDGGGSTRLPSAWCGVVGLHPTTGRVPADHDVARSLARTSWSGSYGPICRDALDAATLLTVLAGPSWRDLPSFNGAPPDYRTSARGGVGGLRIGWTDDFRGVTAPDETTPRVLATVRRAARSFEAAGAIVDGVTVPLGDWYPTFTRITAELSAGALYPLLAGATRAWDSIRGAETAPMWRGDLETALDARQKMAERLLVAFEEHDLVASPTSPRIAPTREEYAAWLASESYAPEYTCLTGHMNLLGFPAISLPAGFVDGMPVGLQLVARPDDDATLLRAAASFLAARPTIDRPPLGA